MKPASRTALAMALSFLLAFGMPTTALAKISAAMTTAAATEETLRSAADGNLVWLYQKKEDRVFIVGCELVLPEPSGDDGGETPEGSEDTPSGETPGASQADAQEETGSSTDSASDSATDAGEPIEGGGGETVDPKPEPEPEPEPEPVEVPTLPTKVTVPDVITVEGAATQLWVYGIASHLADGANQWGDFEEITLGKGIKRIEESAFAGCANLSAVKFADGSELESIGDEAFLESGIVRIDLPAGIVAIGDYAFSACDSLQVVTLADKQASVECGAAMFNECTLLREVDLPATITAIPEGMFKGCSSLAGVSLPDSVKEIAQNAFAGSGISSLKCPASLESIGASAFEGCRELYSVSFNEGMKTIGNSAFCNCATLRKVNFAEGLKTIGYAAFAGDVAIDALDFPQSLATIKGGGALDGVDYDGTFQECSALKRVSFPEESALSQLGGLTFAFCDNLAIVELPKSGVPGKDGQATDLKLKKIPYAAFTETAITSVQIPPTVTEIEEYAFSGCKYLGSLSGCAALEKISAHAFSESGIISLPGEAFDVVRFIKGTAFEGCPNFMAPDYLAHGLDLQGGDYYRYDTTVSLSGIRSYQLAGEALNSSATVKGINARFRTDRTAFTLDSELQEAAMVRASELPVRLDHKRPFDSGLDFSSLCSKAQVEIYSTETTLSGLMGKLAGESDLKEEKFRSIGIGCFMQSNKRYWVILLSEAVNNPAAGGEEPSGDEDDGAGSATEFEEPAGTEGPSVREEDASTDFPAEVPYTASIGLRKEAGYWPTLDLTASSQSVIAGQQMQLGLTCQSPGGYSARIDLPSTAVFMSKDTDIATVDKRSGLVTFHKSGSVEILANLEGASDVGMASAFAEFSVAARESVKGATISGVVNKVYTGKKLTQSIGVSLGGERLVEDEHYKVSYANNTNVGTATVTVRGIGEYDGMAEKTFKITKAKQPITVTAKAAKITVKARNKAFAAVKVKKAQGTVRYYNKSKQAKAKALKVNKKTGKVSVPKKAKAGTYKLKVQVVASGGKNYKKATKTVSLQVRVR